MKALIVEDDFLARRVVQLYLAEVGECTGVTNGAGAIKVFEEALEAGEAFDLICLDLMMPEVDGIETLSMIRRIERDRRIDKQDRVKVVIMTASDQPKDVIEKLKADCDKYLIKPIRKTELIRVLEKLGLLIDEVSPDVS